jgi:hypothetical protein
MAERKNTITVNDGTGDIIYGVSVLNADGGDEIVWTSENGPFTLDFKTPSPWEKGVFQLQSSKHGMLHFAKAKVRKDAPKGRYYYGVAVSSKEKIYTDHGCPEVIIR